MVARNRDRTQFKHYTIRKAGRVGKILSRDHKIPNGFVFLPHFNKLFYVGLEYRAVGVTLSGLRTEGAVTGTLFVPDQKIVVAHEVGVTLDRLSRRFGRNAVFLGSSMKSLQKEGPVRRAKHFDLIYLGEVD